MTTVIQLPQKKRHGRRGGSQVQRVLCVVLALPPSVARPESPSKVAVWKRDARRWDTPLSSPPARQGQTFSQRWQGLSMVPAFQPQSLSHSYPSPANQMANIPRNPLDLCSALPCSPPTTPQNRSSSSSPGWAVPQRWSSGQARTGKNALISILCIISCLANDNFPAIFTVDPSDGISLVVAECVDCLPRPSRS